MTWSTLKNFTPHSITKLDLSRGFCVVHSNEITSAIGLRHHHVARRSFRYPFEIGTIIFRGHITGSSGATVILPPTISYNANDLQKSSKMKSVQHSRIYHLWIHPIPVRVFTLATDGTTDSCCERHLSGDPHRIEDDLMILKRKWWLWFDVVINK